MSKEYLKKVKDYCTDVALKTSKELDRCLTIQENSYIVELVKATKMKYSTHDLANYATKHFKELENYDEEKRIIVDGKPMKLKELLKQEVDMHTYLTAKVQEESSLPQYNTADTPLQQGLDTSNMVNPINLASLFGQTSIRDVQKIFNPAALWIKNYIIMDSRYRNLTTNGTNTFQWVYNDANEVPNGSRGVVAPGSTIRNLISMKLYQFIFPNVDTLDVDSGRLGIYFQEFKDASFIASGGVSYHWLLRVAQGTALPQPSNFFVQCQSEDYQDGILYFNKPIVNIDHFTVNFYNPLTLIDLPYDRATATIVSYGITTTIRTDIPNNLDVGGRIIITGFTTDDPTADRDTIAAMNNQMGILVNTVVNPTDFTILINTSTVTPTVGLVFAVYFAQFRFIMMFEITYLKE